MSHTSLNNKKKTKKKRVQQTTMQPSVWGSTIHDALFFLALSYPMTPSKERKESMVLLITHLFNNLPCPDCTQHAEKMLIETPIRCDSRPELLSWVVHIHNQINARTGKRFNWTVDEAKEAFTERQFGDITVKDVNKNQRLRREDTKVILRQQAEIVLLKQRLGDTKKKTTIISIT